MKHRWLSNSCLALIVISLISLTGCENGNLFGKLHDSGTGDIESLTSDAATALQNKDYSKALQIYEQILNQDPNNAKALKGAAAAAIGTSGMNFGQLLANIMNQTGAPSISSLSDFVHAAQEGPSSQTADPNSLLYGVDLNALDQVIDLAICRLQKIASGGADGSISPNDISLLLNYAALCLLRAVLRPIQAGYFDIVNNNGSYDIVQGANLATICSSGSPSDQALIENVGKDLAAAYALFNKAVTLLNLSGNQIIVQLRDDINSAATILLTNGGPNALPAGCLTILDNAGINLATFQNQTGAFQPGNC